MKQSEADKIESMYIHYNYRCYVCGKPATQRAHLIGDTVANKRQYGAIIAEPLNWLPACSLECNALIDTGKNTLLKNNIERYIRTGNRKMIEDIVTENITRKKNRLLSG